MKSDLEVQAEKYIIENNGIIHIAAPGKIWVKFPSGRPINSKGMKVMIEFNGSTGVGSSFDGALISLKKAGKIDLYQLGYDDCPKCSGTGNVGYNVDGGRCFKCNGFGVIKRK